MNTLQSDTMFEVGEKKEFRPYIAEYVERAKRIGAICWAKRNNEPGKPERADKLMIKQALIFGLTYKGKNYPVGYLPIDCNTAMRGIEIAEQ